MTAGDALEIAAVITAFLVAHALGLEWDHQRAMDDACRPYGKTYSHTYRACVRPQR